MVGAGPASPVLLLGSMMTPFRIHSWKRRISTLGPVSQRGRAPSLSAPIRPLSLAEFPVCTGPRDYSPSAICAEEVFVSPLLGTGNGSSASPRPTDSDGLSNGA